MRGAIAKQVAVLGNHEQELQALGTKCKAISDTKSEILVSIKAIQASLPPTYTPFVPPPAVPLMPAIVSLLPFQVQSALVGLVFCEAELPDPELYSGEQGCCGAFLLKRSLAFSHSL